MYTILKQLENYLNGDIACLLHVFGGYTCRLAASAVVLVLGEYQISIAK